MSNPVIASVQQEQSAATFMNPMASGKLAHAVEGQGTSVDAAATAQAYRDQLVSFAEIGLLIALEFQKLRDAGRSYLSTALVNEFKQMLYVLKKKNDAIDENWNAAIIKSSFEFAASFVTLAGAGLGAAGGLTQGAFADGLQIGTRVGEAGGKPLSAAGELWAASQTKEAQQDQAEADFAAQNAERYAKNIERLEAMMRDVSEKAMQTLATFRDLYERSSSALKLA